MDTKTRAQLATPEFQKYMIKNYLKTQLHGMIRVFRGRYPAYMTLVQMNEELQLVDKQLVDLDVEFISNTVQQQQPITQSQELLAPLRTKSNKVIESANRCHARVWDVNNLVWESNGRQVYGCQCKNPKSSAGSSNYCRKHIKKLTHEDWFAEPSEKMRRHFVAGVGSA